MIEIIFQILILFILGVVLLLALRPVLEKFPKLFSYGLCCVLFFSLLCLFSLPVDMPFGLSALIDTAQNGSEASKEGHETDSGDSDIVKAEKTEQETEREKEIRENFGVFYMSEMGGHPFYEPLFSDKYRLYRFDDVSEWKDARGNWKYPDGFEFKWIPSDKWEMAAQQFPSELMKEMDTEELYGFIMKGVGVFDFYLFDNYLYALGGYYNCYNFIHELMNREDCAQVIHQYYGRYSQEDQKKYSKMNDISKNNWEKLDNFQMTEALEWFFLAMAGKEVPDERVYNSGRGEEVPEDKEPKIIEVEIDITHDGKKDKLRLDPSALYDESKATGKEKTVTVISAETGQEIASYTANATPAGWNGIYLYQSEERGDYLLQWKPELKQGVGNYQCKVYSLGEDGTENTIFQEEYRFNLNPENLDFNVQSYQEYIGRVNKYLYESQMIIDTDQGDVEYCSGSGDTIYGSNGFYSGAWVLDDYYKTSGKASAAAARASIARAKNQDASGGKMSDAENLSADIPVDPSLVLQGKEYTIFVRKDDRQKFFYYRNEEEDAAEDGLHYIQVAYGPPNAIRSIDWIEKDKTVAVTNHWNPDDNCLHIYDIRTEKELAGKWCSVYAWGDTAESLVYVEPGPHGEAASNRAEIRGFEEQLLYRMDKGQVIRTIDVNERGDITVLTEDWRKDVERKPMELLVLEKQGKKYRIKDKKAVKPGTEVGFGKAGEEMQ